VTAAAPRSTLGRDRRVRWSRDFARIRQAGRRLAQGALVANWAVLPTGATSRLGVITSRKVGSAVERSRARRLLRESFRRHQHELAGAVDLVLIARPSIAGKTFAQVERDFLAAARKAGFLHTH
jgi:ribonuclease P protein component